jgi:hypothetical protein
MRVGHKNENESSLPLSHKLFPTGLALCVLNGILAKPALKLISILLNLPGGISLDA